jgi:lipoate-protein ligase A
VNWLGLPYQWVVFLMRGSNILQSRPNANWQVHNVEHSASEMHSRDLPVERGIWNVKISKTALVLGSSQTEDVVDLEACAKANVDVVHRRSGGGAVYLAIGEHLWVDVVVPRSDALWSDDVVISSQWIGDAWSRVLTTFGESGLTVHRGGEEPSTWSKLVCFAGVGPGEVLINGNKVVGISQRRTNKAARFQCFVHRRWTPAIFLSLLTVPRPSVEELSELVAVIDHDPILLFDAFVDELESL